MSFTSLELIRKDNNTILLYSTEALETRRKFEYIHCISGVEKKPVPQRVRREGGIPQPFFSKGYTGQARLNRSHSLGRFCFELSRNSN